MLTHRDLAHATARKAPFTRAGWIFEIKWQGFRVLASHEAGGTVRLLSQKGNDLTPLFPEVAAALRVGRSTVYELIAKGELKVVHIGRAVRVPAIELEAWVGRRIDELV